LQLLTRFLYPPLTGFYKITDVQESSRRPTFTVEGANFSPVSKGEWVKLYVPSADDLFLHASDLVFEAGDGGFINSPSGAFRDFYQWDTIQIYGTANNDGLYTIVEHSATKVKTAEPIINETPGKPVGIIGQGSGIRGYNILTDSNPDTNIGGYNEPARELWIDIRLGNPRVDRWLHITTQDDNVNVNGQNNSPVIHYGPYQWIP
jgi:hypothetical protein